MKILKQKRLELGMTLKEVALQLGVNGKNCAHSVYMYETGERRPSIERLKKYAQLFNCTVDELLKDEKE